MRTSEQSAFAAYKGLAPAERRLVRAWRDKAGADWMTALLASGVLTRARRRHPDQELIDAENARVEDLLAQRHERLLPANDPVKQRRHGAEHEAAHCVVFATLGVAVDLAYVEPGGSGACLYGVRGSTPEQIAAGSLAAEIWISEFRSEMFVEGATRCGPDRGVAISAVGDGWGLRQAAGRARVVLREHADAVLTLADKLEIDGYVTFL